MAQFFSIHSDNPQPRLLKQAAHILHGGGLIALPTEVGYVLACHLDDKAAVEKMRHIRGIDDKHHLTLMCRDLSQLSIFAKVDNRQFRLLKAATPGPFVFILEATREVPRRVSHPSRKTIGLRVPEHGVALALLQTFEQALLTTTLQLAGDEAALNDPEEIRDRLEHSLALVIDGGLCPLLSTTVVDLSGLTPAVVRLGKGDPQLLGL
ncbi:MAG: threonylcarbamoyl-AMP synthase [Ottowia sp.]|nr:threonylcarbamoyl-AMP synthase [Ottowia sp.]